MFRSLCCLFSVSLSICLSVVLSVVSLSYYLAQLTKQLGSTIHIRLSFFNSLDYISPPHFHLENYKLKKHPEWYFPVMAAKQQKMHSNLKCSKKEFVFMICCELCHISASFQHFNFYFFSIAALWNPWKWNVIQQLKKSLVFCGKVTRLRSGCNTR